MRALLLLVIACSSESSPPPVVQQNTGRSSPTDKLEGTLTVSGESARLVACKPGRNVYPMVDVVTDKGTLRFESKQLFWDGNPLDCEKLDRSWGGGNRPDGTSYWRGQLSFRCRYNAIGIVGDLKLDCGDISASERTKLDADRQDMRSEGSMKLQHDQPDAGVTSVPSK